MRKLLLILLVLVTALQRGSTENVATVDVAMPAIRMAAIPQLQCQNRLGTAFAIGKRTLLTAEHVVDLDHTCTAPLPSLTGLLRQRSYRVATRMRSLDLAVLERRSSAPYLDHSCAPLVAGETYWLVGYAEGRPIAEINTAVATDIYGTAQSERSLHANQRLLRGIARHGMSGGPVINRAGQAVAIISGYATNDPNIALVKELADTPLCGSDK